MYSYDFFMNTAPIELFYMLLNGDIQEWLVPDELWNEIGLAGSEYRDEQINESSDDSEYNYTGDIH